MALRLSTAMRTAVLGKAAGDSDCFKDLFQDGVMEIRSGSQPADGDTTESGTMLVRITESSGAFTPGAAGNGLEFGDSSGGSIAKAAGETWSGAAAATGTAGWFRYYDNDYDTGAGSTLVRFDGAVSTSGAELNLSSTSIVAAATTTIDSFTITMPAS